MVNRPEKLAPYEKRFGMIAIEKGYANEKQLLKALSIQVQENLENGRHRLIGEILVDLGIMNYKQVDEVVTAVIDQKFNA